MTKEKPPVSRRLLTVGGFLRDPVDTFITPVGEESEAIVGGISAQDLRDWELWIPYRPAECRLAAQRFPHLNSRNYSICSSPISTIESAVTRNYLLRRSLSQQMERRRRLSRESKTIRLRWGYDTLNQASVVEGRYIKCPNSTPDCQCYGCLHAGMVPGFAAKIIDRREAKSIIDAKTPKAG
jgi:hypothetical protein